MKQFPIQIGFRGTPGPCPSSIPWEAIAPYEGQAKENHGGQSLERLAERGGLSPAEAFMVMHGRRWGLNMDIEALQRESCAFLDKLVRESQIARLVSERDDALLQIEDLKNRVTKAEYDAGISKKIADAAEAKATELLKDRHENLRLIESMKIILSQCADSFHLRHMKSSYDERDTCQQEPCAKIMKLIEKRNTSSPNVCDSCGWNNGPDHGGGSRVMYTMGKVTKCGECLPTTR